jgi:hypothetical protein
MERYLSSQVFTADVTDPEKPTPSLAYAQTTASEAGFLEKWLQKLIEKDPELVLAPCREAELVEDEEWFTWATEFSVPVGQIDVLLISESGRVGIVETKLAYNPEARRSVVAQLLDYAIHFAEVPPEKYPKLPKGVTRTPDEVARRMEDDRDLLLVIAGDVLNPRAVKLGRNVIGDHVLNHWDLAMVEVSVFKRQGETSGPAHILVPHILGAIEADQRQTVKVTASQSGDKARIEVVKDLGGGKRQWNAETFKANLEASKLSTSMKELGRRLPDLAKLDPAAEVQYGKGEGASAVLKRNGRGILEFYVGLNQVTLPKERFDAALGEKVASRYLDALRKLLPDRIDAQKYPTVFGSDGRVGGLVEAVRQALSDPDRSPSAGI